MAPPPGQLGGVVKLPVQVRMFPEEIEAVYAFAAELSQQSYGAAFSRTEALRIAAMEWLKEGRRGVPMSRPPRHSGSCTSSLRLNTRGLPGDCPRGKKTLIIEPSWRLSGPLYGDDA